MILLTEDTGVAVPIQGREWAVSWENRFGRMGALTSPSDLSPVPFLPEGGLASMLPWPSALSRSNTPVSSTTDRPAVA